MKQAAYILVSVIGVAIAMGSRITGVTTTRATGQPRGAAVRGLVLTGPSVVTGSLSDPAGIIVPVRVLNVSAEEQRFVGDKPWWMYRVLVYDAKGNQLQGKPDGTSTVDETGRPRVWPRVGSGKRRKLAPGEALAGQVRISDFVAFASPGIYHVVILREIVDWRRDMLASNLIKLTLTE